MITLPRGCLLPPPDVDALAGADPVPALSGEPAGTASICWLPYVLPSDNQRTDTTCCVRSLAGIIEALARHGGQTIPRGRQVNVRPAYSRACDDYYSGNDPGGLRPNEALGGCVGVGMIPSDATLTTGTTMGAVRSMLANGPVLLPLWTTPGWMTVGRNGYLDPLAGARTHLTGHCVLGLGLLEDRGEVYWLAQDWQGPAHGWHGCIIIHWRAWEATRHQQGAMGLRLPSGVGTGWRRLLIDRAEG